MFLENIANPPRQLSLQTGMMCIGNLNTMRMFHPILIEDTVEIQTTKQGNANILLVHVENVLKNFKRKDLQGNPYNNYHQLSIPYFFKQDFTRRYHNSFNIQRDKFDNTPFILYLHKLGATCELWAWELIIELI